MSKNLCEDYYVYTRLHERGANLAFITWKNLGARGNYLPAPSYENSDGFPIYRIFNNIGNINEMGLFPFRKIRDILSISHSLKPNVIYVT
jgi:hypothetical protein